jgi:uncharacterized protein (DUF427 family)
MRSKPVLIPGPRHPITVEPAPGHVRVSFGDRVIAETDRALVLREAAYPPVLYLPLADVDTAVLEPSTHRTYCPYKGDADYFTLRAGDRIADDAVWRYESPYDAVAPIAGHVAFYPQHVRIEQLPGPVAT